MTDLIEYKIDDLKQYAVNGKIQKMGEKASSGWSTIAQESFIKLLFTILTPGKIAFAQIKNQHTFHTLRIELQDKNHKIIQSQFVSNNFPKSPLIIKFNSQFDCYFLSLQLNNDSNNSLHLGLTYCILKGKKTQTNLKKKINNVANNQIKYVNSMRPKYNLVNQIKERAEKNRQKKTYKEQNQLIRVLKQSVKQYEKTYEKEKKSKDETAKQSLKKTKYNQRIEIEIEDEKRRYKLSSLSAYQKTCEWVNEKWMQAQRNAEESQGVRVAERLSRYINVKHLNGKKVLLDPSLGSAKRESLRRTCLQMGATLVDSLTEYTLLISSNPTGLLAREGKKTHHVKVVNPAYVEDCLKCSALLPETEYMLQIK